MHPDIDACILALAIKQVKVFLLKIIIEADSVGELVIIPDWNPGDKAYPATYPQMRGCAAYLWTRLSQLLPPEASLRDRL